MYGLTVAPFLLRIGVEMSTIERNDVDVSRIFNWGKKFDLKNEKDEVIFSVYLRLLGDADLNRARVYALRRSADLRTKLRTPDSDERIALIFDPDNLEEERFIYLITTLSMRELTQEAIKESKIPAIKIPKSDAPLEEMERYQKEVDSYDTKRSNLLRKNLDKLIVKFEKQLKSLGTVELKKRYEAAMINEVCEQEVLNAYKDYAVYAGTYKDAEYKERFFSSIDEVLNLRTEYKNMFINAQQSLELTSDDLKKLQPATQ